MRRALVAALLLAGCGDGAPEPGAPIISDADREYGAQAHPALLAEFGGAYAGEEAAYVDRLGGRLAAAAGLDGQCTFTLVNSDVVNAFAVPGCFIYVTRGLMAIVTSEAELGSVLAHEIGHIVGAHSQRQERRSLWRTLGVIVVSLTGSEQLTRLAGRAAEFFTLRYSRSQEYQADDLGIAYLKAAGYDPHAAADMLGALGRQDAFMAATAGRDAARGIPEWARSHPLTESRIARARDTAAKTGVADGALPENETAYLNEVDGLLYGDDPAQGFVIGRRFAHPVMRIGFAAPPGFTLTNSPQAIRLSGPDGVRGEFGGGAIGAGGIEAYAAAVVRQLLAGAAGTIGDARRTTINGLPAVVVPVRVDAREGPVALTLAVYDAGRGQAYQFVVVAPAAAGTAATDALIGSFRLLTDAEVATLTARTIRVVRAGPGDTAATLGRRMADPNGPALFRALNGDERVAPGEPVKLVVPAPLG